MFKQLVIMLLSIAGITQRAAAEQLGYKTPSSLQSAIINKDLKLTVLNNICKLCNLSIIITDNKSININLTEYIQQHSNDNE